MQPIIDELEELRKQTDYMLNNKEILEQKDVEKYLRNFEKIRYDMLSKIKIINNIKENERDKIVNINNSYKSYLKNGILKIYIPETLPKYKNINNYAYKNIMLNTANAVEEYQGLFNKNLTLVLIIVHENQVNMDIDNKHVKPIIDALVIQHIIQDDNINNMFYMVQGKNDCKKPYTEVFVMDGKYMVGWIEKLQKMFKKI